MKILKLDGIDFFQRLIGLLFFIYTVLYYFYFSSKIIPIFCLITSIICFLDQIYFKNKISLNLRSIFLMSSITVALIASSILTFKLESPILFWFALVPMLAGFVHNNHKENLKWYLIVLISLALTYPLFENIKIIDVKEDNKLLIQIMAFLGVYSSSSIFSFFYQSKVEQKEIKLISTMNKLKDSQKKLSDLEKTASIIRIAGGISHEISTPLNIIDLNLDVLKDAMIRLEKNINEPEKKDKLTLNLIDELKDFSRTTKQNIAKCANIITSFKSISGGFEKEILHKFDLKNLIEDVIKSLDSHLKQKNVKFNLIFNEETSLTSFSNPIDLVFSNLIRNSLSHAFEGTSDNLIEIQGTKKNNTFFIVFRDNGLGVKKDIRDKIFDPFFTTKPGEGGGTGLGLALVKSVISKLGGSIVLAESKNGTEFHIELEEKSLESI